MNQTSKTNIYIKRKWGNRSQIELAKAVAEKKDEKDPKAYESYKGYVSKWFNTDQEPGKDYLFVLSEILNVNVESILKGEDVVNEYGERPTVYSAARTGDESIIKRLFGNKEADIWLHDVDEYRKSFVDYVIEYNNYNAFRTAIKLGYGYPVKNVDKLEFEFFNNDDTDVNLLKMLIENDDIELFLKAFPYGRMTLMDGYTVSNIFRYTIQSHNHYYIPNSLCVSLLNSSHILDIFMESKPFTSVERRMMDDATIEPPIDEDIYEKAPTLSPIFNFLLDIAIQNDMKEIISKMLNIAQLHIGSVKEILGDRLKEFEIESTYDGSLTRKRVPWRLYGFMPYVKNPNMIKDENLKKIALNINENTSTLRRK